MSINGMVLIIHIRPVFGITIWLNTNTLFGLLLGLNRIQIEYSVQPWLFIIHSTTLNYHCSTPVSYRQQYYIMINITSRSIKNISTLYSKAHI